MSFPSVFPTSRSIYWKVNILLGGPDSTNPATHFNESSSDQFETGEEEEEYEEVKFMLRLR